MPGGQQARSPRSPTFGTALSLSHCPCQEGQEEKWAPGDGRRDLAQGCCWAPGFPWQHLLVPALSSHLVGSGIWDCCCSAQKDPFQLEPTTVRGLLQLLGEVSTSQPQSGLPSGKENSCTSDLLSPGGVCVCVRPLPEGPSQQEMDDMSRCPSVYVP